jgi:hypothetical protein
MAAQQPWIPPDPGARAVHDERDYDYYWSVAGLDIPIPRWLAEIIDVPLVVRFEIFLVGVCTGLLLALAAVLIAFFSAT